MRRQKYTTDFLKRKVYDYMNESWARNAITAKELSEKLKVTRKTAKKYLERLAETGYITKDEKRNDLYWREL